MDHKAGSFKVQDQSGALDEPKADDVALFLHTSGTTSRPKGVPLNQGNLAASLANIALTYELSPKDRSLLVMPLFHVHGLMAGDHYGFDLKQILPKSLAVRPMPLSIDILATLILNCVF